MADEKPEKVRFIKMVDDDAYSKKAPDFCGLGRALALIDMGRPEMERLALALFDDTLFEQAVEDTDPYCCPYAVRDYRRRLVEAFRGKPIEAGGA